MIILKINLLGEGLPQGLIQIEAPGHGPLRPPKKPVSVVESKTHVIFANLGRLTLIPYWMALRRKRYSYCRLCMGIPPSLCRLRVLLIDTLHNSTLKKPNLVGWLHRLLNPNHAQNCNLLFW